MNSVSTRTIRNVNAIEAFPRIFSPIRKSGTSRQKYTIGCRFIRIWKTDASPPATSWEIPTNPLEYI